MPARDTFHDSVRHALVKDGWTITHDPYTLTFGQNESIALVAFDPEQEVIIEWKS